MLRFHSVYTVLFISTKQPKTVQILCFSRGKLIQRKATIRGKFEYYFKHDEIFRPRRLFWEENGKWKPYPPKNTIQEILSKAKYILFDENLPETIKNGIRQFCKDFVITTQIQEIELCPFCLIQERITILQSKDNYLAYDRKICKSCGIHELEKELSTRKINLLVSPGFKKYAISLLTRLHDVHKVTEVLTSDEPVIGELTLIKKIERIPEPILTEVHKKIDEFDLPKLITSSLKSRKIESFLPIQVKSIQEGLLKNKNFLIMANTSAGKTLIGEIAGISHIEAEKKKMIFTVPLVALANTKFEEFKKYYGKSIRIGLRTGHSRIFNSLKEKEEFYRDRFSIKNADIIVATYEGLDLLIRANQIDFTDIGCFVIDEIQTLSEPDRGPTLDCLLAKIKCYAQNAQILALSATIGNPIQFAKDLELKLVTFDQRPIPLEEHIIISRSEQEKFSQLFKLVKKEYQLVSKNGYKGQTIIFTNSRRKTTEISEYLLYQGIKNARSYHSGLAYLQRKRVESEFASGKCPVVVSTYALGAGVDFPASQVIFESLMMGNQILGPNNFTQMVGRAGRLGKHDRGRVILLCLGESISSIDTRSEVEIAFELINADLQPINPLYSEDSCGEQIMAICSTVKNISPTVVKKIYQKMVGTVNFEFMKIANNLIQNKFLKIIKENDDRKLQLTPLGQAATLSFFSPSKVLSILTLLRRKNHFAIIAIEMNAPQNIYLSKKLHSYLEKTYNMRFSTRLINSSVLDVMSASLHGKEATELNNWCLTIFAKWTQNFFNCNCRENPYCSHGEIQIGQYIMNKRLEGKNIYQISAAFSKFELMIYPGDILSFLNGLIHELEGIQRITAAIGKNKLDKKIGVLIDKIETPRKS